MSQSSIDQQRMNLRAQRKLGLANKEDKQSEDDFMEQCISNMDDMGVDDAEEVCQNLWDEQGGEDESLKEIAVMEIVHKTHNSDAEGMEFILSDATVDRYGDTIDANGWVLDNFNKNPIALFNHQSSFPIGTWSNLRVQDNALRGHLTMAKAGTSARHDELRSLIDAKILRAVSVGFLPLDSRARKDDHGYYIGENFIKQELIESSLVAVPANPNAVAVAKALRISDDTMNVVFAKHGSRTMIDRGADGDTFLYRGVHVPVKRFETGVWRGQKTYRYE